jgi:hypothetical protein
VIALLAGCVRIGRVLVPEEFAVPQAPRGDLAVVTVASGWRDEAPGPYAPAPATPDGGWLRPVEVTDRGRVELAALRPDVTLDVYVRHDDLVPHDFRPVLVTTHTLPGRLPTALAPLPGGALDGPVTLAFTDLQSDFSPEPVVDGDLVWVRLTAPGAPAEDYVFRARSFGLRYQGGAGVWVPFALPGVDQQADLQASPALVGTLAVHHRWRTRSPAVRFLGEQLGLVAAVGVGSTALEQQGPLEDQARGAFDAAVAGGGLRVFQLVDAALLVNVSSAFRDGPEAAWTAAVGVDAVRASFVAGKAAVRLFSTHAPPTSTVAGPRTGTREGR